MNAFGIRLREERKRLELSQDAMALAGGVQRLSQINYEAGKRSPDWDYLALIAAAGVDVQYVLTGQVSSAELAPDEDELLRGYRCLDIRGKVSVLGMIDGLGTDPSAAVREKQAQLVNTTAAAGKITGKRAQVIQGNNMTGKTTIQLGRKKKDAP